MTTMNVSLPDSLKHFVDQCVEGGSYGSPSEYVRELIRQNQVRRAEVVDAAFWAERRARLGR
jgi:antitoxin ParD1/3/4